MSAPGFDTDQINPASSLPGIDDGCAKVSKLTVPERHLVESFSRVQVQLDPNLDRREPNLP